MKLNDLMELIEIDSPEDFSFFEQFAALMEIDVRIPFDVLYLLFSNVDPHNLAELTESYFQEILDKTPDDEVEFHSLMSAIGQNLAGLASIINRSAERSDGLRDYTEEFFRFRNWYLYDSDVVCEQILSGNETHTTVFEALVLCRLEELGEERYVYDFSESLDYPLNEYIFPINEAADGYY